MRVDVETTHGLSYGRSVHDRWGIGARSPNCEVAIEANADGFFDLLTELVAELN